jgi:hypothetical protein
MDYVAVEPPGKMHENQPKGFLTLRECVCSIVEC